MANLEDMIKQANERLENQRRDNRNLAYAQMAMKADPQTMAGLALGRFLRTQWDDHLKDRHTENDTNKGKKVYTGMMNGNNGNNPNANAIPDNTTNSSNVDSSGLLNFNRSGNFPTESDSPLDIGYWQKMFTRG